MFPYGNSVSTAGRIRMRRVTTYLSIFAKKFFHEGLPIALASVVGSLLVAQYNSAQKPTEIVVQATQPVAQPPQSTPQPKSEKVAERVAEPAVNPPEPARPAAPSKPQREAAVRRAPVQDEAAKPEDRAVEKDRAADERMAKVTPLEGKDRQAAKPVALQTLPVVELTSRPVAEPPSVGAERPADPAKAQEQTDATADAPAEPETAAPTPLRNLVVGAAHLPMKILGAVHRFVTEVPRPPVPVVLADPRLSSPMPSQLNSMR